MKILTKLPKEMLAIIMVMNQDLKLGMIQNMKKYGGSFVKCLADCFLTADPKNLMKLTATFDQYVREYLPENWSTNERNTQDV